jgi:catechol 2,3-dioxygenase-like lactoylglutathione lyase family enzyme
MQLDGIAHIQLTVADVKRSVRFYEPLLHAFEMSTIVKSPEIFSCVGSRTGVAISQADPESRGDRFRQRSIGLHHFCFRARSREDPDGIRIEVNYVPGKGHLDPGAKLPLADTLSEG